MRLTIHILLFLLLTVSCVQSYGQYTGYKSVANVSEFKQKFKEASTKIQTIQGDFKQQKTLAALTEEITSHGKIWFKRESKVRMDYTKPFVYKMIMNNDKMLIRDGEKENRINVKSNKLFQQINRITVDCMQGAILESADFKSKVFENENNYLLELTPVSKSLKEFFSTIVLVSDKKDSSVKSIELNEPSGDKTSLTFSNKVINSPIADEVFAF